MKKINLLLTILMLFTIFACSSSDDNDDSSGQFFTKAYLEIYTFDESCHGRLFLTNGTATVNSTDGVALNGDATNVVDFPAILMNNCELDNPSVKIWDLENGLESDLNSMFRPYVFYDYDGSDGSYNMDYATSNIVYAELNILASGVSYEIEMIDGTILTQTYNGEIEVINTIE